MISPERTDGRTTKRKTDRPQAAGERPVRPMRRRRGSSASATAAAAGGKPDNLQFYPHFANNAPKGKYSNAALMSLPWRGGVVDLAVRWVARLLKIHPPTDRRSLVLSQVLLRLEVHSRCYSHSCYSLDVAKRVSRKGDRPERTGQTLYGSSRNSNLADQETRPFRNSAPQSCRPGDGGKGKVGGLGFGGGGAEPFSYAFLQRVAVMPRQVSSAHLSCFAAF